MYKCYKISEIGEVVGGGTPSTKNEDFWGGDIPWITPKDLAGYSSVYISKGANNITEAGLRSGSKLLPKNTVLITSRAPIGYLALASNPISTNQGFKSIVCNEEKCNPLYLYYYLKENIPYLKLFGTGATFPEISGSVMRKIKLNIVEDTHLQSKIANILKVYDDLIEKNNRKIEILQDMAEELYKEWFVRFRFPGYKTAKFTDGIPDGWEVKRMNDFCYVTDGTHDTPKPQLEGIPLVTGKCIDNGFIDFSLSYPISIEDHESIKVRSGLKSGDILFSNIGTVGTTCVVDYTREFSVKNVIIFKPESKLEGNYLYYWLNSKAIQETFSNQTNGASQQFVGLTFMRRFKILVPTKEVLEQFSNKVDSIVQARKDLHNINENLKTQRDLLLPRLMSGKLEVKVKQEV